MEFYKPFMQAFEQEEEELRFRLGLSDEAVDYSLLNEEANLQKGLTSPLEVWHFEDEIGQNFYTHICEHIIDSSTVYQILITSYVDDSPAFVFYRTLTMSKDLLKSYQKGNLMESSEDKEISHPLEQEIASELLEEIEAKKSMLLAQILEQRSADDIDFEEFILYDKYLEQTIAQPDEMYIIEDESGDNIYSCIRFFKNNNKTLFFYIALALAHHDANDENVTHLLPIIGFPSNDKNIYSIYSNGERLNKRLNN